MKRLHAEIILCTLAALGALRFTLHVADYGLSGYALFSIFVSTAIANRLSLEAMLRIIAAVSRARKTPAAE